MIKKIILGVAGIAVLLIGILAVHIYQVTAAKKSKAPSLAMSKILLHEELDSLSSLELKSFIQINDGVKDARINRAAGHAICLYDRNSADVRDIISSINQKFELQATLFQPSADELAMSCPAIDRNSVTFKLGNFFENLFAKL
ncbi:heavy-metal-associated domain-containing protein [Lunatibacter salilacus]|uniref:heavy-metal-associated domain-containing protein n=1 Tax=Lunatibacter salilacus TaxID=2483804 RepID=UPI00131E2C90|nr:heavy-metal-associated domain-containing protein [Lunatibacter salilacus]